MENAKRLGVFRGWNDMTPTLFLLIPFGALIVRGAVEVFNGASPSQSSEGGWINYSRCLSALRLNRRSVKDTGGKRDHLHNLFEPTPDGPSSGPVIASGCRLF